MPKQFGQMKPGAGDPTKAAKPTEMMAGDVLGLPDEYYQSGKHPYRNESSDQLSAGNETMNEPGSMPDRLEGPQILWDGAGPLNKPDSPNMEDPGRMAPTPTGQSPELTPKKKKKFDWKGAIQAGIDSYQPDDEDPMAVLSRMQGNESTYMNRPIY